MGLKGPQSHTIKDRSIDIIDLNLGVFNFVSGMIAGDPVVLDALDRSILNTNIGLINTLEIEALKQGEANPNLSFFVDSFDDADLIDPESSNFSVNEVEGSVGLQPGGSLTTTDTTKAQFDLGTYTNIESYTGGSGGDGALRKTQLTQGALLNFEDMEDISNVSTIGSATQSQTSQPGEFEEGSNALKLVVDFSGISTTESAETTIDLLSPTDFTIYQKLLFSVKKTSSAFINYDIELEDNVGATYSFPIQALIADPAFQQIEKLLSSVTGIDLNNVRYVRFRTFEDAASETVLSIVGSLDTSHTEVNSNSNDTYQTFIAPSNSTISRIKIRTRWEQNQPTDPLVVNLTNSAGVVLNTAQLNPGDASATFTEYVLTFDTPISVTSGIEYRVKFSSATSGSGSQKNGWDIHITGSNIYTQGQAFTSSSPRNYDIHLDLLIPITVADVFIDNFYTEGVASYASTGSYLSVEKDLSEIPTSLDLLYWDESPNQYDLVEIRVRFATTQGGLSGATWSAWYSDPTGTGNDLSGITPQQWFQYEVRWTGGDSTNTDEIRFISLDYTGSVGGGSAIVISQVENTLDVPTQFLVIWQDIKSSGTINYYISRDGKITWQSIPEADIAQITQFTVASGTQIHLRAIITGNAKLFGWTCLTDQEFI